MKTKLSIKQHKLSRGVQTLSIKDGTYIHRYGDKKIPTFERMIRVLNK
jgi:hypothetical protein